MAEFTWITGLLGGMLIGGLPDTVPDQASQHWYWVSGIQFYS